ncbi:MAG: peptidylprolyl isomerase, partial [Myxococcales bacterium]|nr:peptidylprolyl isomerase [Myxococcales bacterium]
LLATVNGTPITETDVRIRMGTLGEEEAEVEEGEAPGEPAPIPPETLRGVLETLIREELTYQRAVELGLDAEPSYAEQVGVMEAQLRNFRRRQLGQAFFRQEIDARAEASDEEVRAYFEAHAEELRKERHILQLLLRDREVIESAHGEIAGGAPFEAVAARQFAALPEGARPWDLGFLRWAQLPEPWKAIVASMSPGETSGVIEGPGGRYWIIHLVAERIDEEIDLESVREPLRNVLRGQALDARRQQVARELREAATIEYVRYEGAEIPTP